VKNFGNYIADSFWVGAKTISFARSVEHYLKTDREGEIEGNGEGF